MACLGGPVVVRSQGGCPDEHVAHPHLAPAVALAVIAGKPLHQHPSKLSLAIEEDPLVGHEHVVENGQGLYTAELGIAHVHLTALPLPGVTTLAADNHVNALAVYGHSEGHRVVLVVRAHGDGGHHDDLVAVQNSGLMHLGAPYHDAVLPALYHPQEQIRVLLGVGCLGPIALGVGHGPVHRQVLPLYVQHEFFEVFVIVGTVLLVHLVGGGIHRVKRVHTHTPLEAGGRLLAQPALHLHLVL